MADSAPPRRVASPGGISNSRPKATENKNGDTPRIAPPSNARKAAVVELLALPQIPLAGLAAVETARNPEGISVYAMDVWAIQAYSEPIADAVVQLADAYPVLGTLLDRMTVTAPILALAAAAIGLGVQLAENHGSLPAGMQGLSPSLIRREDLAQQIRDEAEKRASATV
jgi:hypothetical protein